MGCYVNPTAVTKEAWLRQHGSVLQAAPKWSEVPEGWLPVCLVDNAAFSAAGVAFCEEELSAFSREDGRSKRWYVVPVEELRKVSPLDNWLRS